MDQKLFGGYWGCLGLNDSNLCPLAAPVRSCQRRWSSFGLPCQVVVCRTLDEAEELQSELKAGFDVLR